MHIKESKILLCLTPDDFTCQGEPLGGKGLNQLPFFLMRFISMCVQNTGMEVCNYELTYIRKITHK